MRIDVPEYNTFVDFPDNTPPEEIGKVMSQNFPPKGATPERPLPHTEFINDVRNASRQRGLNVTNPEPSAIGNVSPIMGNTLNVASQGVGLGLDVAGAVIKQGLRGVGALSETTGYGKNVIEGAKDYSSKVADYLTTAWDKVKKFDPAVAADLERVANVASVLPIGTATKIIKPIEKVKGTLQETGAIVSDATRLLENKLRPITETSIKKEIDNAVKLNLSKSIKTSAGGVSTWPMVEKYFNKGGQAVEDIINNKPNLNMKNIIGDPIIDKLPTNPIEMAQAITNTKAKLFNEYNNMQLSAGGKGATISLDPIAKELDAVIGNKALNSSVHGQATIAYAKKLKGVLEGKKLTPQEAQDWITNANDRLISSYTKGDYMEATQAGVDMGVASMMRNHLDDLVTKTEGAGYQNIKNRYGSLVSLEAGTNKAAFAEMTKKKLPNFFDITSGTALVHGLLTMNPAVMATAGFMEGLNIVRRHFTNPNTYVERMFKDVEGSMLKRKGFQPESKLGQKIMEKK